MEERRFATIIVGVADLLQHRYVFSDEVAKAKEEKSRAGEKDYSNEWKQSLHITSSGEIYEPAVHVETAMIKAAVDFLIIGKGKKTYKDLFKSSVFVSPQNLMLGKTKPDYLAKHVVCINGKSRIERVRPAFNIGWKLSFEITVWHDQISATTVRDILTHAGTCKGIGDYRPKYGRFMVKEFKKA